MSFSVSKKSGQKRLARHATTPPKQVVIAHNPLYITQYSEKSFVVLGDTLNHSEALVRLGGTFNPSLRIGQGWIFSKNREPSVQKYIETGEIEPFRYTQEQQNVFNNNKGMRAEPKRQEPGISVEYLQKMFQEFREAFDPTEDYEGESIISVIDQLREKYLADILTPPKKPEENANDKKQKEKKATRIEKLAFAANTAMINNVLNNANLSKTGMSSQIILEMNREKEKAAVEKAKELEEKVKEAQQESEPAEKVEEVQQEQVEKVEEAQQEPVEKVEEAQQEPVEKVEEAQQESEPAEKVEEVQQEQVEKVEEAQQEPVEKVAEAQQEPVEKVEEVQQELEPVEKVEEVQQELEPVEKVEEVQQESVEKVEEVQQELEPVEKVEEVQ